MSKSRHNDFKINSESRLICASVFLQGLQTEVADLRSKCAQLSERNDVLQSELNNLRETYGRVSRAISDKEFELAAAQEKINSLSQLVRHDSAPGGVSSDSEVETLMREKEAIHQQVALLRQERDQLVSALQQTQVENEQMQAKVCCTEKMFWGYHFLWKLFWTLLPAV